MTQRTPLTPEEFRFLRELRKARALKTIQTHKIASGRKARATVIIACSDGDRFPELLNHHRQICGDMECFHSVTAAGGALVLPTHSPMRTSHILGETCHWDTLVLGQTALGMQIKQTGVVHSYAHYPCGMCRAHNVSPEESITLHLAAKDVLRERLGRCTNEHEQHDIDVACMVHIDYIGWTHELPAGSIDRGDKRSYQLHRRNLLDFLGKPAPHEEPRPALPAMTA